MESSSSEIAYQSLLKLITQFYCSLSVRKNMQNISCEIREFVMLRQDIKNKQQTSKRILDFFLQLESKLIGKSDKQWDRMFEISTARGYALLRICNFPNRHVLKHAMNKVNSFTCPEIDDQFTILAKTQCLETEAPIEVHKDIKTKTYFFFKWCEFTQYSKMVKQMKKKEVQNQKLSATFNKYGLKSHTFAAWKIYCKKSKHQKIKAKTIESKCRQKLLRYCFESMQQMAGIVAIQASLTKKVKQKLTNCQLKSVFGQLKKNEQRIKRHTKIQYKSKFSQIAYIFLRHLTSKLKPGMNKSYKIVRQNLETMSQKNLVSKCFESIRKSFEQKQNRINRIMLYRKTKNLLSLRELHLSTINFNSKCELFDDLVQHRKKRVVLAILSFNRMLREQQFNTIHSLMQNNQSALTHRSFIQVTIKKTREDKKAQIVKDKIFKQKKLMFYNLKGSAELTKKDIVNQNNTRKLMFKRLRYNFQRYIQRLNQKQKMYEDLQKRCVKMTCSSTFSRWRSLKWYKKLQISSIQIIEKLSKKLISLNFWNKLQNRAHEKCRLRRIVERCQGAITKLSFLKIVGRSTQINSKVKGMRQLKDTKLKRMLFNLLVRNEKFNHNKGEQIESIFTKRFERMLVKKLKSLLENKTKLKHVQQTNQKIRIKDLFNRLSKLHDEKQQISKKCTLISKKTFIINFRKSILKGIQINQQNQNKSVQLDALMKIFAASSFFGCVKKQNQIKQILGQKQNKILTRIARKQFVKIRQYIQLTKIKKHTKDSQKIIQNKIKSDCLSLLTHKCKIKNIENFTTKNLLKRSLIDLKNLCKTKHKIQNCRDQIYFILKSKNCKQFYRFLAQDKQEIDNKIQRIQQIHEKIEQQKIKDFIDLLNANKENNAHAEKLGRIRKQSLLSELIATSLKYKFGRLKFNCSLKSYAKNLMKKAFKSLKQSHSKLKQKQNMLKLDRTSSIMVQKSIEKSHKSNTLSQQIHKFNLRRSRQLR